MIKQPNVSQDDMYKLWYCLTYMKADYNQYGLCYHINNFYLHSIPQDLLDHLFKLWGEYSGDIIFPVPHPDLSPEAAYDRGYYNRSIYTGEYGALRYDLWQFMIDELEDMINGEDE